MSLSSATIAIIKATAPVVAPKAREITNLFYKTLFMNKPEVFIFFNKANQAEGRQPQALANAIVAYASNIDNLGALGPAVGLMASKHCGLQVLPEHYGIVHENLMKTIGVVLDGVITPEIANAWSEAVLFLAGVLINAEESLYKVAETRSGGWRGWKEFEVSNIEQVTPIVKTFTFVPKGGKATKFDFTPGQYLSVLVDPYADGKTLTAPRHYTVTSPPGANFLQVTTKRLDTGVVSGFMHDKLKVGSTVKLSPPFGDFTASNMTATDSLVLLSAGIGMTPMKSFLQQHSNKVAKAVHVECSADYVPFKSFFEANNKNNLFLYSKPNGHPSATTILDHVKKDVGLNHKYFVCGPSGFMCDVVRALHQAKVPSADIRYEAFAPTLSCPM